MNPLHETKQLQRQGWLGKSSETGGEGGGLNGMVSGTHRSDPDWSCNLYHGQSSQSRLIVNLYSTIIH